MNMHITQKLEMILLIVGFSLLLAGASQVIASASNIPVNDLPLAFLDVNDTDGDGLNNTLEGELGTNPMDKYGDKDEDGLYDFEEILDIYGTPNNKSDKARYQFNNSVTHDSILDIYHYFNLTSNKTAFMRDEEFSEQNGGFTDYLLWNITFTGRSAGGLDNGEVHYINNVIVDCLFSDVTSGGGFFGSVLYKGNIVKNTTYSGDTAGGSRTSAGNTTYESNILTDVTFSGKEAGGSTSRSVFYINNTLNYVDFLGERAGGSEGKDDAVARVDYVNNTLNYVNFVGEEAGGSYYGEVSYTNNTISYANFSGQYSGGSNEGKVSYVNNSIKHTLFNGTSSGGSSGSGRVIYTGNNFNMVNFSGSFSGFGRSETNYTNNQFEDVRYTEEAIFENTDFISKNNSVISDPYDSDDDGLGDIHELFNYSTNPFVNDTDSDGLSDSHELFNYSTNPLTNDTDSDGLSDFHELFNYSTKPLVNDTDGDGLLDGWEARYSESSGVNPLVNVTADELSSDEDKDGLTLIEEYRNGTNPFDVDTDGDGMSDGWEVLYSGVAGVDPITMANSSELESDQDNDSLTLLEESVADTDPLLNDTDGDGLLDGWEARYSESSGVDPLVNVTTDELSSDEDKDGLTLWDEYRNGTNPFDVDTDSDGMSDGWEVLYSGVAGVDPITMANSSELESDQDNDSLTLLEESVADTDPLLNDTDGDGLLDGWEARYSESSGVDPLVNVTTDELSSDEDKDGLTLIEEYRNGTNPFDVDTDGDGMSDGWEVLYSSVADVDPLTAANSSQLETDQDNDSLTLLEESVAGTNPLSNDTDSDGLSDTWEVRYSEEVGIDPLVEVNDSVLSSDLDSDGLDLWDEYRRGTNPFDVDTDSDGMGDGWEVLYSGVAGVDPLTEADSSELESDLDTDGLTLLQESVAGTDPLSSDSDNDDLSDSWEFLYSEYLGIDPLISVADSVLRSDLDSDGLALWDEYRIGTNPFVNDTDGDGLNDGWEDTYEGLSGVNPLVKASSFELASNDDDDGLSLKEEALTGTNPIRNDTDGDGLNDGWEVRYNDSYGVNPLIKATDEELLSDRDSDGLNLLQEAIGNTDPETADNTEMSEATAGQSISDYYFAIFVGITALVIFVILLIVIAFIIRFRRRRKKALRRKRRG